MPDNALVLGILLGLGSALASSLAYLASRRFTVRHAGHEQAEPQWRGPLRLMVTAHLYLAVACGIAYFFLLPRSAEAQPADWSWAITTSIFVALFYLTGNTLLFFALRRSEASRIAPLLGMKIVLLALITHFFLGIELLPQQWLAVALATLAALMLGSTGGRLPWAVVLFALGACAGFVGSDIFIGQMVPAWLPTGLVIDDATKQQRIQAAMTGMSLVYVWCGAIAFVLLPLAKPWQKQHWTGSAPYAGLWFIAMICLFSAFSLITLILVNILQATRGLMSILIGVAVMKLGHHHIESHASLKVVIQRCIAAALMVGAIALYVTAKAS
ncbi:MAG: EamA family transporter [Phycisphaeraceae bacterium]